METAGDQQRASGVLSSTYHVRSKRTLLSQYLYACGTCPLKTMPSFDTQNMQRPTPVSVQNI